MRMNDMIITPLVTLFLFFIKKSDVMVLLTTSMQVYRAWKEWIEYTALRFEVQRMFLRTMEVGGPFIVTNNPTYMPYVFADAVVRTDGQHR